jgi:hypothetical protein
MHLQPAIELAVERFLEGEVVDRERLNSRRLFSKT